MSLSHLIFSGMSNSGTWKGDRGIPLIHKFINWLQKNHREKKLKKGRKVDYNSLKSGQNCIVTAHWKKPHTEGCGTWKQPGQPRHHPQQSVMRWPLRCHSSISMRETSMEVTAISRTNPGLQGTVLLRGFLLNVRVVWLGFFLKSSTVGILKLLLSPCYCISSFLREICLEVKICISLQVEQNISPDPENKVKKNHVLLPPRMICGGSWLAFHGEGTPADQALGSNPALGEDTAWSTAGGHRENPCQGASASTRGAQWPANHLVATCHVAWSSPVPPEPRWPACRQRPLPLPPSPGLAGTGASSVLITTSLSPQLCRLQPMRWHGWLVVVWQR